MRLFLSSSSIAPTLWDKGKKTLVRGTWLFWGGGGKYMASFKICFGKFDYKFSPNCDLICHFKRGRRSILMAEVLPVNVTVSTQCSVQLDGWNWCLENSQTLLLGNFLLTSPSICKNSGRPTWIWIGTLSTPVMYLDGESVKAHAFYKLSYKSMIISKRPKGN